jgi:F-type H+-transporting ATPase subunit b
MNGYSNIEQEKEILINAISLSLEQLGKAKNETLYFEKQRAMNQVRQWVSQQDVQTGRRGGGRGKELRTGRQVGRKRR